MEYHFVNMTWGGEVPFREGSSHSRTLSTQSCQGGRERECSSEREESGGVSRLGSLPWWPETSRRGNLSDLLGNPLWGRTEAGNVRFFNCTVSSSSTCLDFHPHPFHLTPLFLPLCYLPFLLRTSPSLFPLPLFLFCSFPPWGFSGLKCRNTVWVLWWRTLLPTPDSPRFNKRG